MGSQKGAALVIVLVAFMIISLLLFGMLDIAAVERKMSRNNTALLQARQAVDGGVAWACEQTYQCLQTEASSKHLPRLPVGSSVGNQAISVHDYQLSYRILNDGVKLIEKGNGYCVYEFACEGCSRGVVQNASVRVRYRYSKHYRKENGTQVRVFIDHGKIIYYRPVDNTSTL